MAGDEAETLTELEQEPLQFPEDRRLQLCLAEVSGQLEEVEHVRVSEHEVGRHEETRVRVAAVQALRHVSDREADETLAGVMFDEREHARVRATAVRTAGARRTQASYASIAELATEEEGGWVQIAALHTLGRAVTRSEDAAEALRHLEANAELKQVRDVARDYLYRLDAME